MFIFINRLLWYIRKVKRLLVKWGKIEGALGRLLWSVYTGKQKHVFFGVAKDLENAIRKYFGYKVHT